MRFFRAVILVIAVLTIGVSAQSVQAQTQADDGKIVFVSDRDRNGDGASGGEIYAMNTNSTDQVRLTHNNERNRAPSWSPDGQHIAFSSSGYGPNSEIYVVKVDGSDQQQLTDGPKDDYPSWSPDGQHIAYSSGYGPNSEIYVVEVDGSGQHQLTHSSGWVGNPSWSPDGQRIAFSSGHSHDSEIYVVNVNGSGQHQLTHSPGRDDNPSWSPDGQRIAYSSGVNIYVMNADGSSRIRLTDTMSSRDIQPSWSPDGQRIVFASDRDGDFEIFVMKSDGSDQKQITHNSADDTDPNWAPSVETSQASSVLDTDASTPTISPTATPRPSSPTRVAPTPTPHPPPTPSSTVTPTPSPAPPTPAPQPTPERGFFFNSLPSQGDSGQWDFMDPVALSIIGICLTLLGTLVQLFRGR